MGRPSEYNEATISTGLRLPVTLHTRLTEAAAERQLTMNRLVRYAIEDYLDRLIPVAELKLTRDR